MSSVESVHALIDQAEVDRTIDDLIRHGIRSDEIQAGPAPTGRWLLRDELLHDDAVGTRLGATIGFLVGTVIGVLVALSVPAIRDAGAAAWLVTAVGIGGFGAIMGAMTGLQLRDHNDDDPLEFVDVEDGSGLWALSVESPRWSFRAHRILERHGVDFVEYETPAVRL